MAIHNKKSVLMFTDGGARGNPGPAGVGVVLAREGITGLEVLATHKKYLGDYFTNNQAEYSALILGLTKAREAGYEEVEVRTDSELMAEQMSGRYKVKNPGLQELFRTAHALSKEFKKFRITAVRRERNAHADALVNEAIDEHT